MGNNLPKGWTSHPLKDVVSSRKGKKPATVINYEKKGYDPYLLIDELEGKPARAFTNDSKVPRANKEDVLLVWDGSIGKCASGISGAVGSTIAVLSPKEGLNTKFLEYFIRRSKNRILETSTGTGLQHINKSFLKTTEIPLPSNEEQQERIADKLDSLLAKVNDAQSRLDKIPTILSRFRQSILAAAFSSELTKAWRKKKCSDVSVKNSIPESWCWTKLGELSLSITSGSRGWAKYYSTKGAIFIRSQDIKTDSLDLNNVAHVSLPNKAEGKRTKVTKGDLLITITGANVAKAACIDRDIDEAYVSQHVGLIRLKNPKMANFIHLCMISSNHGRKQLLDSAYGVGKPGLNLDNLKDVDIACPPLDEQQEINRVVKEYFSEIDKIALRYRNTKNCTNRLEQSILAKAFRGELAR
jgi:type I restriction enzyme, S subunit